jgi:hypothetical protein
VATVTRPTKQPQKVRSFQIPILSLLNPGAGLRRVFSAAVVSILSCQTLCVRIPHLHRSGQQPNDLAGQGSGVCTGAGQVRANMLHETMGFGTRKRWPCVGGWSHRVHWRGETQRIIGAVVHRAGSESPCSTAMWRDHALCDVLLYTRKTDNFAKCNKMHRS